MSSEHVEYALNSLAWLIGGFIAGSVYWRVIVHRQLVKEGAVKKETSLNLFVAWMAGLIFVMGLLFSESGRIQLTQYVKCQAGVNQDNYNAGVARTNSAVDQLKGELAFYSNLANTLSAPPNAHLQANVLKSIQSQISIDLKRLETIQKTPTKSFKGCHTNGKDL